MRESAPSRHAVVSAVAASWARDTAAQPDEWTPERPAHTQCDASSFVVWEYLRGELVLGRVLVDGEVTQHHYWNRFGDEDLDVTAAQFDGHEVIEELRVVGSDELRANLPTMRDELRDRIDTLRSRVVAQLGVRPSGSPDSPA